MPMGGTGCIGHPLLEHGTSICQAIAFSLLQVGRTGRLHQSDAVLASLAGSGALVVCTMADMACTEDSNGLLGGSEHVQGFIHAAGVLQDGALRQQTFKGMRR